MARIPDEYGPLWVGNTEYGVELAVSGPITYSVGYRTPLSPEEAREVMNSLGVDWVLSEPEFVYGTETERTGYRFVDENADTALSPAAVVEIVEASGDIAHIVPVYRHASEGTGDFAPVPSHVVVTGPVVDESALMGLDRIAAEQDFYPLLYRDTLIHGDVRRIYSSQVSEPAISPDLELHQFEGEFGAALVLIDDLSEWPVGREAGVRAEPNWYVLNPNDLGTPATRVFNSSPAAPPLVAQPMVDQAAVKVAVLDGEFDLNHASGKLPFSAPFRNAVADTANVDVIVGHAHGTLCAGLVGAREGIDGWHDGGIARTASIVPVSVYLADESVVATVEHLVDGIDFAVSQGCRVVSISLAGFAPASSLIDAVQRAEDHEVLLVAGTGNRRAEEFDAPDFVLYPAGFGTVIGVGAALIESSSAGHALSRITLGATSQVWESRFGRGIDVVAPGIGVTSTDISGERGAVNDCSPDGDVWDAFSGTSAATPLVAGFAAVVAAATDGTAQEIRDEIRRSAVKLGPYDYDLLADRPGWNWEVGYGWVDRATVDGWQPSDVQGEPGTGSNQEDLMSDNPNVAGDSVIACGVSVDLAQFNGRPYWNMFASSLRPLTDFLGSLGSTDAACSTMAAHFWRDPYKTARIAGVPWPAAILVGGGDWKAVYEAVDVELHRVGNPGGPGPIWVRAR